MRHGLRPRLSGMLIASVLTGCASGEKEVDTRAERLGTAWRTCLSDSYRSHRSHSDANTAAEAAFRSCQTEENVIQAYLISVRDVEPSRVVVLMAGMRSRHKQSLTAQP
jgi:hypothetical protein